MPSPILAATFHLTHHCNLRCTYCYTGEKRPIAMSRDTVDASIDFILREHKRRGSERLDITFFGGEPLLEKDHIFYIVNRLNEACDGQSINYRLSTNASLLTQELMVQLMTARIFVSLSMDGPPHVHDLHRPQAGGQSSSQQAIRGARILLKHNPCASVTCVISPNTAEHLVNSVDFLYELGFRYLLTTLDFSADWTVADFKKLKKAYQGLATWYETKMKAQERFYLSYFDERIRTRTHKPIHAHERCNIGGRQFSIAPDGALYPCIQFVTTEGLPEYMIGHVKHGFDEACQTHINRASEHPKTECQGCALESRCSKWCSCINFMSTGSIEKASPVVCYNERILMEIVDRTADRLWRKRNPMFLHKHYNPDYPIIAHYEISL